MVSIYIPVMDALKEAGLNESDDVRQICLRLDECCVDFGCERIEVAANGEAATLEVTLCFDDIIMEHGRAHPFFKAIEKASLVEFSTKDGLPVVKIVYAELNKN